MTLVWYKLLLLVTYMGLIAAQCKTIEQHIWHICVGIRKFYFMNFIFSVFLTEGGSDINKKQHEEGTAPRVY